MASTYRFYVAQRIGDGATTKTALRSKLANYIVAASDGTFWDWSNRSTAFRFCLAFCDTSLHTTIAADVDITALSPELVDEAAVNTWLDGLVGMLPAGISTKLEAAGFPVDWIVANTTRRQMWRFLCIWNVIVQKANGDRAVDALSFIAQNLDATVGSLPANVRNNMSTWMTSRGLDITAITGATKVRAVVKGIINSGIFTAELDMGPVNFR